MTSPSAAQRPAHLPFGRWLGDFAPLSEAEENLVAACAKGEPCVLDDERPEQATAANTIRAGLIRFLALGGDAENPVHECGVQLNGAWISETLDLDGCKVEADLVLLACHCSAPITAYSARLAGLNLGGSAIKGLDADRMTVLGSVFLRNGFSATGEVRLPGVTIGGNLDCSGGSFTNESGKALSADGCKIAGSCFFRGGFTAKGEVRLLGASIGGNLDCSKASFTNESGHALSADRSKIAGSCFFGNGFTAKGEVRLLGASIGGDLGCSKGSFTNESGKALSADRSKIAGNCFLRDGFTAKGEVRLLGASIGGDLDCFKGSFTNEHGKALSADGCKIAGSCFFRDSFAAKGEVRLPGATIGGNLECSGGSFTNEKGKALSADGCKIAGSCFFSAGFTAKGEVRLPGATIGGNLGCSGGSFTSESGTALNAQTCIIKSVLMLKGATIRGAINLGAARVGTLADAPAEGNGNAPACWHDGRHILDGFTYDRIVGASDAKTRIAWLNTQRPTMLTAENWAPQPWEQLIKVLREMGHPHEATKVAIEKQRMMRKAGKIGKRARFAPADTSYKAISHLLGWMRDVISGRVRNLLHCLSGALIGHGYDVTWAVVALIAVMGGTGWAYQKGYERGYFGPTNAVVQMHYHDQCGAPGDRVASTGGAGPRPKKLWNDPACTPPEYTSFQAFFYSLDLILPVVNLGQDGDWAPMVVDAKGDTLWWGEALRGLIIIEILFGWGLTLLIAAVMTNLIKKD